MLTREQREAVFETATRIHHNDVIGVDADVDNPMQFDQVPNGVWVRAWVFVSTDDIPGYSMEPPAPPSSVTVESTVSKSP